jgi:hypothetical protein
MKQLLACAVAMLFVMVSGCQNGPERADSVKTIVITKSATPDGKPTVSMDPVELSIKAGEQVEWKAAGGEDFVVSFGSKTPFGKHYFHESRKRSGGIRGNKDTYKYTVLIEGQELDPSVIIKD